MESYEGDLALGLQNRLDFGFSEGPGNTHRAMALKTLPSTRARKSTATRTMHKEHGHMLDFMIDHGNLGRKDQRKQFKISSNFVDSSVSGPRLPGQGCNQLTQEIVSAICLDDRTIVLRITILAAGFVIGPRGSSIKMISERCNVDIESKTVQHGEVREFKCIGNHGNVVKAVQIMKEAVNTYKVLTEGDYKGQCVQSTMVILGVTFDYCPPPKSKMPHAASVMKLSQKLAVRKEENSSSMTMDSSSSVDSTQGLEPYVPSDGMHSSKYNKATKERRLIHASSPYSEETRSNFQQKFEFDTPWRSRECRHVYPSDSPFSEKFSNTDFSEGADQIPALQNAGRMSSAFISPLHNSESEGLYHDASPWGATKRYHLDERTTMRNLMREYGSMDI